MGAMSGFGAGWHSGAWRVRRFLPIVVLAVALGASGCATSGQSQTTTKRSGVIISTPKNTSGYRGTVFDDPYTMPDVTLTDTADRPFNLRSDTDKPVTLLFFGYTNCPDICTTTVAGVASALRQMNPQTRDKVEFVFITTDPRRDTRDAIRGYLDRFNDSFVGLRAPLAKIKATGRPLDVSITGTTAQADGGYTVGHTGQVFAFNPRGKARVLWTPGTPVGDLRHDLTRLVNVNT